MTEDLTMEGQPAERAADAPAGASGEVASLATERLEAEIVGLSGRLESGTFELLVLVGELDARGSWALAGCLSCAAWLASHCDIEPSTAANQVRVARAMRAHPELLEAMRNGDVSYAKARILVPHLAGHHVPELVDLASRTPSGRLGMEIARWSQRCESPAEVDARHQAERSMSWRTDADGMVTVTTRLPPAAAGLLCAAVDKQVTATTAPAGASLRQQRADALVQLATTGGGGDGSGVQAELVVHVTADGNHLTDGTPLTDHAVAALLPDGFVSLLLHDAERQPIDASPRRRLPTRRQQRVVDALQDTCQHPGCTATAFLQYDHVQPYAQGGPTVIANLQRLCGPHNRARNAPREAGTPPTVRPPSVG
jgi:hypothetical protein